MYICTHYSCSRERSYLWSNLANCLNYFWLVIILCIVILLLIFIHLTRSKEFLKLGLSSFNQKRVSFYFSKLTNQILSNTIWTIFYPNRLCCYMMSKWNHYQSPEIEKSYKSLSSRLTWTSVSIRILGRSVEVDVIQLFLRKSIFPLNS